MPVRPRLRAPLCFPAFSRLLRSFPDFLPARHRAAINESTLPSFPPRPWRRFILVRLRIGFALAGVRECLCSLK